MLPEAQRSCLLDVLLTSLRDLYWGADSSELTARTFPPCFYNQSSASLPASAVPSWHNANSTARQLPTKRRHRSSHHCSSAANQRDAGRAQRQLEQDLHCTIRGSECRMRQRCFLIPLLLSAPFIFVLQKLFQYFSWLLLFFSPSLPLSISPLPFSSFPHSSPSLFSQHLFIPFVSQTVSLLGFLFPSTYCIPCVFATLMLACLTKNKLLFMENICSSMHC